MTKLADNPPAFPFVVPAEWQAVESGMTLRDYFAGQALTGLLAHASGEAPRNAPEAAWMIADMMLELRARETAND